jgi:hypothetical protein
MYRGFLVAIFLFAATSPTRADDPPQKPPTYDQILSQPHLWPDKVAIRKPIRFVKESVAAGEVVNLVRCEGNGVILAKLKSDTTFRVPPVDTDLFARATQLRQSLTPEQLALDYPALLARPDLWPTEVAFRAATHYPNGSEYPNARPVPVVEFDASEIWVFHPKDKQKNHAPPEATDLLTRAREAMALPPEKRVPRLTRALQGRLMPPANPVEGVKASDPPPGTKYYVLLFAASDKSDTQQLITDVSKFYGPTKPKHPEVEVITYGLDKAMIERKSPWRRIDVEDLESLHWLRSIYESQDRPLIVFDAYGRTVPDGGGNDPTTPKARLDHLKLLLEQSAPTDAK